MKDRPKEKLKLFPSGKIVQTPILVSQTPNQPPGNDGTWRERGYLLTRKGANVVKSAAAYWYKNSAHVNMFTFTLPALKEGLKPTDVYVQKVMSKALHATIQACMYHGLLRRYVWVSELQQKNGRMAVHYHLLTDSFIRIKWINGIWCNALQDVAHFAVNAVDVESNVVCGAAYITKYISKGTLSPDQGYNCPVATKRYGVSKELRKWSEPQIVRSNEPIYGKIMHEISNAYKTERETTTVYSVPFATAIYWHSQLKKRKLKHSMQIGNAITLASTVSGAITGNATDGWLALKIVGTTPDPADVLIRVTSNIKGEILNCGVNDLIAVAGVIPGLQAKKPDGNTYIVVIPCDVDKGDVNISIINNDAAAITVTAYDLPDTPEMLRNCVQMIRKFPTGGSFSDEGALGVIVSDVALISSASTPQGTYQSSELVATSAQTTLAAASAVAGYNANCYLPAVSGKYSVTLDPNWTAGTDYIISVKPTEGAKQPLGVNRGRN